MKKVNLINLILIVLLFEFSTISKAQNVTISCNTPTPTLIGQSITVPITINCSHELYGYNVYIQYDKNVLTYNNGSATCFFPSPNNYTFLVLSTTNGLVIEYYNIIDLTHYTFNNQIVCNLVFTFNGGKTNIEKDLSGPISKGYYYDAVLEDLVDVPFSFANASTNGPTIDITSNGGNWSSASSWNLSHVPNTTNNAIINSGTVNFDVTNAVGNLTINSGGALTVYPNKTLSVNGSFLIKSDVNGTGSFINNGTYTGTATVQRYIPKDNSWHLLSCPVDGASQNIVPNFAPTTVDNTFDFYKWDEAIAMTATTYPWINLRATSTTYTSGFDKFENGRGYLVAYSPTYLGTPTHEFFGTLNNADQTITVSNSLNHYNLLGNPFPSAIDWDYNLNGGYSGRAAVLGSTPSIYIYNQTNANYGAYNGTSGTGGVTKIIAPHQGFFVEAISGGQFTIPTGAKVHPGSQPFLKSTIADLLRLKVTSTINTYSDEMIVNFDANATPEMSAAKWFSMETTAPSLYSVNNGKNLTINTLTQITNNLVVPVSFKAGVNGTYTINASELNSFNSNPYIYLKDLKTNYIQDLNQNANYSFVGLTSDNADRFQLLFALSPLSIISDQAVNKTNIYSYDNTVFVNSTDNVKQISIYNTIGQLIYTSDNPVGLFKYSLNGNNTGYYIVKVITDKNVSSEKVFVK